MSENEIFALIIEDDSDAAFISKKALEDNGYRAEVITRGDEAQEQLQVLSPEVILLDLHLPYVAGTDLLDQILNAEHLADTKVILVTADPRIADSKSHLVDMILLKPVTYSQIRSLTARIIKKSKPSHSAT